MDKVWIILDGGAEALTEHFCTGDDILEVWDDHEACLESYRRLCEDFPNDKHSIIDFPIFKVRDIDQ